MKTEYCPTCGADHRDLTTIYEGLARGCYFAVECSRCGWIGADTDLVTINPS